MKMDSLNDMYLVLEKKDSKYYLPTIELIEVEVEGAVVAPYFAIRVKEFDNLSGILRVKLETDKCNEVSFQISTEKNSTVLEGVGIKKILFVTEEYLAVKRKFKFRKLPHQERMPIVSSVVPGPKPVSLIYREKMNEEYDLSAHDIKIEDGKATFKRYVPRLNKEVLFEVKNDFFKKEYDPVKNYFFKTFPAKKIKAAVFIEVEEGRIVNQTATSERLEAIDASILEFVIDKLIRDVILEADGDIYALEEKASDILVLGRDNKEGQMQALLNKLFVQEKTKHYNHLSYLSSKHLDSHMKLMLTGGPLSFMFLLKGLHYFFFIWEPYSSDEATYIWKLKTFDSQQLQEEIRNIHEKVKWLKKGHKKGFIKKEDPLHHKIIHDYQLQGNGFKKWQGQLKAYMDLIVEK